MKSANRILALLILGSVSLALAWAPQEAHSIATQDDQLGEDVDRYAQELEQALTRSDEEWKESLEFGRRTHDKLDLNYVQKRWAERMIGEMLDDLLKVSHKPDLKIIVKIYASDIKNAMTSAGPYIYVSTDLLNLAGVEFAYILAHELAHIMNRSAERMQAFAEEMDPYDPEKILEYSRQLEHEADILGLHYFLNADMDTNWNTTTMAVVSLQFMRREEYFVKQDLQRGIETMKGRLASAGSEEEKKSLRKQLEELKEMLRSIEDVKKRSHPTLKYRIKSLEKVGRLLEKAEVVELPEATVYILTVLREISKKKARVSDPGGRSQRSRTAA